MPEFDAAHCCLCSEELSQQSSSSSVSSPKQVQQVLSKGLTTLRRISCERGLQDLLTYLRDVEVSGAPLYVHFECRQMYQYNRKS